ncbi:MAG: NAD(+) synthase [Pirellulales bacterium]
MQLIRLGAAALNQTPLDWEGNLSRIVSACEEARRRQISILCCPELCISGYGCEDAFHSSGVLSTAMDMLLELEPVSRGLVLAVGLPVRWASGVYDGVALLVDGDLLGISAKQHLAGDGLHYEPRWFRRWPSGRQDVVAVSGRQLPFGDLRFNCGGVRIGFEICEDAWVADRPGARLAARGVDVILNPSASHFAFRKDKIRRRFVLEGARAFASAYVLANHLGNESGRIVYDGSTLIAGPTGLVACGRRFSFADVSVVDGDVDIDAIRLIQARGVLHTSVSDHCDVISHDFTFPPLSPRDPSYDGDSRDEWERSQKPGVRKKEEFTRAVSLGLIDSLRKSKSKGFVVSASGGADSSAVICLIAIGIAMLSREHESHTKERLGLAESSLCDFHDFRVTSYSDPSVRAIVAEVLRCVYQSTNHSSTTTREAARGIADAVGAKFYEFDVEPLVQKYEELAEAVIGRDLSWETDDIARQNIQARVRAPGVWLLANLYNAILVATSNRSEVAVGYATMDGDTAGGIAPIAGIDKAFLREWLRWVEHEGPQGIGPLSAMGAINKQQPTAELRPTCDGQTDESDLMPYDVLDRIERFAIRDQQMPVVIWEQLLNEFPQHDAKRLGYWTERFFLLWSRNQWKRERLAPSFHLDDESLDPKSWCRFPILSGGFSREIQELREAASVRDIHW